MEQMGQDVAEPGQSRNLICLCGLCCRWLPVGVPHSFLSRLSLDSSSSAQHPLCHEAILQAPQLQPLVYCCSLCQGKKLSCYLGLLRAKM